MRFALLLALASVASAQIRNADAPNPESLGEEQVFKAEGIVFKPVKGSAAVAADGAEGQRVIALSRMVRVEGRDTPLGIHIEVIRDLDFETWLRITEGNQGATGLEPVVRDLARRHGLPSWRADLPQREAPPLRVLAIDAGDRVVVIQWTHADDVERAFGKLLVECAESVKPEGRERKAVSIEPAVDWSRGDGPSLKYPDGWTVRDTGDIRTLANPGDRFEVVSFGFVDKSLDQVRTEWQALVKSKPVAGAKPIEGGDAPFGHFPGFSCRSSLVRQGIEVVAATRFVRSADRCFFVLMTTRADRWDKRKEVMDGIFATIRMSK